MSGSVPDKYTAAAAEYYQLQRSFRRCRVVAFVCAGGGIAINLLVKPWSEPFAGGLTTLLMSAFFICFIWGVTSYFALRGFVCPRCGRSTNWPALWDGWPEATCKYCQLPARPILHC